MSVDIQSIQSRTMVKIFIGCFITAELRLHLNTSQQWKQASIIPFDPSTSLQEVHYRDKNYLGQFLLKDQLTILELKDVESFIKNSIRSYCPDYLIDSLKICIFSQVFVA